MSVRVAVIGAAGSVGGPVAFYLGASKSADDMLLVDVRQNVAEQHAMDMSTAFSSLDVVVRAGTLEDLAGSDIVINTVGAPQGVITDRMEMLGENIPLVRDIAVQIERQCPAALVITVTNPVDPLNYAAWRAGGFGRHQTLGYTLNDSLRFREMVARAKGVQPRVVEAVVIGEHGSTQVPLFSSVRIGGLPAAFNRDEKDSIRAEMRSILRRYEDLKSGRTAGWTCAVGMAALVRAVRDDTGGVFPCSVVLDGEYGLRGLSMSVPVALGREGVREIIEWELAPDEREQLDRTAAALVTAARSVDETFGVTTT